MNTSFEIVWNIVASISSVGVLITIILWYSEIKHSKRVSSADLTLRLWYDIFNSRRLMIERKRLASLLELLLEVQDQRKKNEILKRIDLEARSPLDFMEDLGILFNSGAILKNYVYESVGYWVTFYWLLAEEYIMWVRAIDAMNYRNFEALYHAILKREVKGSGLSIRGYENKIRNNREAIRLFLMGEKALPA